MNALTGDMQLVTLGKGLARLDSITDSVVEGLFIDITTQKFSSKCVGTQPVIEVIIRSENVGVNDISIKCHPSQIFYLRNGGTSKASDLRGKRLISIGQNLVYCTEVREVPHYSLMYKLIKESYGRDYVFINGIQLGI